MEIINYANGANMTLPADAQIVQGVSGNAVYLPAGAGTMPIAGNRNELTISLWRQWDGVVEADHYRGVFSTANIKVAFDQATDFLTIELADTKTVTDIKDDQEQTHWCFLFSKNGFFKIYKNAELKAELTTGNYPVDFSEGFTLGGGRTHATFDEVLVYVEILKQEFINGLYHLISKGTVLGHVEHLIEQSVPLHTPRYLGTVKTPPEGARVNIALGPKNGFNDASIGDWILIIEPLAQYQKGWCYRWTGSVWQKLDPPANYTAEYSACLKDQLEKCKDLFGDTNFFGAVFCQFLGFNKAVGQSLAANTALLDNLTVKRLLVDNDTNDPLDFELAINREVGILAKNNGKTVFEVTPLGNIYAKDAFLQDGTFTGDIYSGPLELSSREPTSTTIEIKTTDTMKSLYSKYKAFGFYCDVEKGDQSIKKASLSILVGSIPLWGIKRVWVPLPNPLPGWPSGFWRNVPAIGGYANVSDYVLTLYKTGSKKEFYYRVITDINKTDTQVIGITYKVGDVLLDERIEQHTILKSVGGAKTLKLKDLPTMPPQEAGFIWVDDNKILHIS